VSAGATTVSVRTGPLVAPVLGRVVGMLAARAQCPIDRLDDAMLLTDAIAAHAPGHVVDGMMQVEVAADEDQLRLTVGNLRPDGAAAVIADADLPGVGNVLERVATEVRPEGGDRLVVVLRFAA
jgi:hypothetical protein